MLHVKQRCLRLWRRTVLQVILAGLALLQTQGLAEGSITPAKPLRLRGIRQSSASKPTQVVMLLTEPSKENEPQWQSYRDRNLGEIVRPDVRHLETMFENTETQKHVGLGLNHPTGVPHEKAVGDGAVTGAPMEMVEEAEELAVITEGSKAPLIEKPDEKVGPVKEEPKELFVHNGSATKSPTPKSNKVKGVSKKPDESPGKVLGVAQEEDKTADYKNKTDEEPVEEVEEVEEVTSSTETPKKGGEEPVPSVPPGSVSEGKGPEGKGPEGKGPEETPTAPGKGNLNGKSKSALVPNMTEIYLGVHYTRSNDVTPTNQDYAQLAQITSHVCDYIYRIYFEDIEETQFLSTDRLPIFEVDNTDDVKYKVAAYFDGASSSQIPNQSDLTDIVVRSLRNGTTYYAYYLFLMQNLNVENAFASVTRFDLFSQTSHLTGPGEIFLPPTITQRSTSQIFKVIVPIVAVLLVSVIVALVYMNWVESHQVLEDEGAILNKTKYQRPDPRKRLYRNRRHRNRRHPPIPTGSDGEHSTLPSDVEESSDKDAAASVSASSARFADDDVTPSTTRRTKQVRVSPKVLYRTFNPGDFSSRVDFEEVNLQNDYYDDDEDDECPIPLDPKPKKPHVPVKMNRSGEEAMKKQRSQGYARVLDSATIDDYASEGQGELLPSTGLRVVSGTSSIPWDELSKEEAEETKLSRASSQDHNGVVLLCDHGVEKRQLAGSTSEPIGEESIIVTDQGTEQLPSRDAQEPTIPPMTLLQHSELDQNLPPASPRPIVSGKSADEEEEFEEEEVLSADEVTVASEYEEEVVEEEADSNHMDEAVCESDGAPESGISPSAQHQPLEAKFSSDDSSVTSALSQSKLPPKQLRDFWEKKSAKQVTVRDFWEQQTKLKKSKTLAPS